jgi:hypothetical protein
MADERACCSLTAREIRQPAGPTSHPATLTRNSFPSSVPAQTRSAAASHASAVTAAIAWTTPYFEMELFNTGWASVASWVGKLSGVALFAPQGWLFDNLTKLHRHALPANLMRGRECHLQLATNLISSDIKS